MVFDLLAMLVTGAVVSFFFVPILLLRIFFHYRREKTIAFFHPFCDAGGGGERVLWCLIHQLLVRQKEHLLQIKTLQKEKAINFVFVNQNAQPIPIVIYTSSTRDGPEILKQVLDHFGVDVLKAVCELLVVWQNLVNDEKKHRYSSGLKNPDETTFELRDFIRFERIKGVALVDPKSYPRFTLLLQSLGSMLLCFEALVRHTPTYFVDTAGFAFAYPVAWVLAGATVSCYIHYPTVSTDMLEMVKSKQAAYNNDKRISDSNVLTYAKVVYYNLFALAYGIAGRFASSRLANSRWTAAHIQSIFKSRPEVLYPPVDLARFTSKGEITMAANAAPLPPRKNIIVSLAQFRPEKNHELQIEAFSMLVADKKKYGLAAEKAILYICGSVRSGHEEDAAYLARLQKLVDGNGLDQRVKFKINVAFEDLVALLNDSKVAVHTMVNEHFGISLVEFLAAGCVVVAHNSGGPKSDILAPVKLVKGSTPGSPVEEHAVGFLATTAQEFADYMAKGVNEFDSQEVKMMRLAARRSLKRFPDNTKFGSECVEKLRLLDDRVKGISEILSYYGTTLANVQPAKA